MSQPATSERAALRAAAELCGRLLLRELGPADLALLRTPDVAAACAELGLAVPAGDDAQVLDELAADHFDTFLAPASGGPPVESLWRGGAYEGGPAAEMRRLAESAALTFDRDLARGAPPDHLGSQLCLWAQADESAPEVAAHLGEHHLAWGIEALRPRCAASGFYGSLARATVGVIEVIAGD